MPHHSWTLGCRTGRGCTRCSAAVAAPGHLYLAPGAGQANLLSRRLRRVRLHDRGRGAVADAAWSRRELAFLISGGTGSGKTTLLAALLGLVPPDERIVIVEDSRELAPDHPHVVRMEGRPANAELAGAITPDRPGPAVAADAT